MSLALALMLAVPAIACAEPTLPILDQSPNLNRPGTTPVGELDFDFTHRFSVTGGKVSNSPTFELSTGVLPSLQAALRYATNSDVHNQFNEWEPSLRATLLGGTPVQLGLTAAYNSASISGDAELAADTHLGPLTLLANARGFSSGYGVGGLTGALGAGAVWHLNRYLALSADYGGVVSAQNRQAISAQSGGLNPAWSAALQFQIPYSPHVLSLYVTNANTRTLEGASRDSGQVRGGFEFLIPFRDLARWQAIVSPPAVASATVAPAAQGPTRDVAIHDFQFGPASLSVPVGTTVRWTNQDSVQHTCTSDTGLWDSGPIDPGGSYRYTFTRPGDYAYHCVPHPFMKGVVHVH